MTKNNQATKNQSANQAAKNQASNQAAKNQSDKTPSDSRSTRLLPQSSPGLRHVCKSFEGTMDLNDASIQIPKGVVTGLMGPSGSGKTTLLRLFAGLETPDSGTVTAAPSTAFVFQEDRLLPALTVRENLAFVMHVPNEARINEMLAMTGLTAHAEKLPAELSGGMKRRTAIARAFCTDAALILMDEPFNGLDTALIDAIAADIRLLTARSGAAVLVVSHRLDELVKLGAHILTLAPSKTKIGYVVK